MPYIGNPQINVDTKSWLFTGNGIDTEYILSGFPSLNNSSTGRDLFVQVNGVLLVSPNHYDFDYPSKKVTFVTPPALNSTVLIRFMYIN